MDPASTDQLIVPVPPVAVNTRLRTVPIDASEITAALVIFSVEAVFEFTNKVRVRVNEAPSLSETRTANLHEPVFVGVPEMRPAADIVNPRGSAPLTSENTVAV